ncbi:unnamed protein product [Lactuca virosa]|uniref:Reverse transcriptase/retrotransposon-derived protein RNase H-like domain-containing protein n=1 Tax=Lactuca virosa TaxID=75947 RepID=A0AAU9MCK8_9ASTR|nr:unnamed protein product [Lactuca virosa]
MGHIISSTGVTADPSKITSIQTWPTPASFTALRGFLGLTGYYLRFIKHYDQIAAPLTNLLKLNAFTWSQAANQSFLNLKSAMISLTTLTHPNFDDPSDITTDASSVAI